MRYRQSDPCHARRLEQLRSLIEAESSDGLELLRSLSSNPICSIYLDESIPCITMVWKRYATSTQLRYLHESVLELLRRHGVNRILGDDTVLPTIHADDQRWLIEDWMPRAAAAGLRAAASKRPTPYFGRLAIENIQSRTSCIALRCFDDLEAARGWLRSLTFQ